MKTRSVDVHRPMRRFFCAIFLLMVSLAASGQSQRPATTTISDIVYRSDGTPASGTITISWPAFNTTDNKAVAAGTLSVVIGNGGAMNLGLVPNEGATPAGTYYKVVLNLDDGTSNIEYWTVPKTSPATISAIRSTVMPASVATQMVTRQYMDANVVHNSGNEAVAGVKTFSSSPTVPAPVNSADVTNKTYVDNLLGGGGSGYVRKSGDSMTGPLTLAGDPTSALQASTRNYVDKQFASKFQAVAFAKDFGALCDGLADDTAAVQAAINSLGEEGGRVVINGMNGANQVCRFGALTYPARAINCWTILEIAGWVVPLVTFEVPTYVAVVGRGYAYYTQFQSEPAAIIVAIPGVSPVMHVSGPGPHVLEHIHVDQPSGIGIQLDNGSDAVLRYVSVLSTQNNSISVEVRNFFWVWFEHCTFDGTANAGTNLHLTGVSTLPSYTGLIYISDSRMSGNGMVFDAASPNGISGPLYIDGLTQENATSDLLTVVPNSTLSGIVFSKVEIADPINPVYFIGSSSASAYGTIRNVTFRDGFATGTNLVRPGTKIYGLNVEAGRSFDYSNGWGFGAEQKDWSSLRFGELDAQWSGLGAGTSPSLVPFSTFSGTQSASQWGTQPGNATVTTGVIAPDGSSTAAKLSSASGTSNRTVFSPSTTLNAGDWVLAGVWIKSEDATVPPFTQSWVISSDAATVFDTGAGYFFLNSDPMLRLGASWVPVIIAAKVMTPPAANPVTLTFDLKADTTHPTSYWMPWLAQIPAGTMTDVEVMRLKRLVLRNVIAGMPSGGGLLGMFSHQKLYWGNDTNLYRSAPGTLKTDGAMVVGATGPSQKHLDIHGGNTSSLPGYLALFNNSDSLQVYVCASGTNGRAMLSSTPCASDTPGNYALTALSTDAVQNKSLRIDQNTLSAAVNTAGHVPRNNGSQYVDAQLACGDLSNSAPSCSTDTTNASNISSGILPAARMPAPSASTLGGVNAKDCSGTGHVQKINADGSIACSADSGSGYTPPSGTGWVHVTSGVQDAASSTPTAAQVGAAAATTTVNGHPLSSNVTLSASDLTTGTLPHAQLPALLIADIPNNAANTTGNAATATAFATTPAQCTGGQIATGVQANGNANCTAPPGTGATTTQFGFPQNTNPITSSVVLFGPLITGVAYTIPTNGANSYPCTSQLIFGTNPASTWTGTLYRIPGGTGTPVSIGAVQIASNGAQTWSVTQTSFSVGDGFQLQAPSTVDASAANPMLAICVVK